MTIELPKYNWFVNGQGASCVTNRYSGSIGTSPSFGCINVTTFNYRVFLEKQAERSYFVAECFLIPTWREGVSKKNFMRAEFEDSQDGLDRVAEWLSNEVGKYRIGT